MTPWGVTHTGVRQGSTPPVSPPPRDPLPSAWDTHPKAERRVAARTSSGTVTTSLCELLAFLLPAHGGVTAWPPPPPRLLALGGSPLLGDPSHPKGPPTKPESPSMTPHQA